MIFRASYEIQWSSTQNFVAHNHVKDKYVGWVEQGVTQVFMIHEEIGRWESLDVYEVSIAVAGRSNDDSSEREMNF
jgi:hypothetical protein